MNAPQRRPAADGHDMDVLPAPAGPRTRPSRPSVAEGVARLSPDAATWWLVAVVGAAALALHATLLHGVPQHGHAPHVPFPALLLGFALAELCVVHLRVARESVSFSLAEVPLVLGLALAAPSEVAAAYVLGAGAVLALHRRQPLLKLAYNLAHTWFDVVAAVLVWHAVLQDADPVSLRGSVAALLAAATIEVVSGFTTGAVVAVRSRDARAVLPVGLRAGLLSASASACFALVALDVLLHDWHRAWTVVTLAGLLALAHRLHLSLLRRHDALESVQQFTRRTGSGDLRLAEVVEAVLRDVRELLSVECATLVLAGDGGGTWTCDADGVRPGAPAGEPTLTVPLHGEDGDLGTLSVTARPDEVAGLRPDDVVLLDTLAAHAGTALSNSRLTDLLRQQVQDNAHQALHDALTGLPNRARFDRAAGEVLDAGRDCAVLLFDLDRFKEVNDTLGHAAGDAVLQAVGRRLAALLPDAACVARLGGDEFAVVLADAGPSQAQAAAHAIRDALAPPLELDGLTLSVDASTGIAHSPAHGTDTATLLRSADIAMYAAKAAQSGSAVYEPERDHRSAARLSMVADLRTAIGADQLLLAYQPKTGTTGRSVSGVEALVRWQHPVRGIVPPDEFIGLAERTGLIGPLTDWVLRTALLQCRAWLDAGLALGVAVNVSPRSLRDLAFADQVLAEVARAGVPPALLTLEVTEGAMMADPERGIEVLRALRAGGVRLSVDDLGVGHSSLAYLKQLPVHEVKIDRSFVTDLAEDPDDEAIVAALVQLGHRLGMTVVAEGVEDERTLTALARLGADTAQGYWMSRPLPAADVAPWVTTWTATAAVPPQRRPAEVPAASL